MYMYPIPNSLQALLPLYLTGQICEILRVTYSSQHLKPELQVLISQFHFTAKDPVHREVLDEYLAHLRKKLLVDHLLFGVIRPDKESIPEANDVHYVSFFTFDRSLKEMNLDLVLIVLVDDDLEVW